MRMRLFARRGAVVAVVLGIALGSALVVAASSDLLDSRARPGALLDLDLATGRLRFNVRAQTAFVSLHALGRGLVVVTGADSCSSHADRETMYAYSLPAGTLRWHRGFAGACSDFSGPDALSGGVVAVSTRNDIEGWDATTGRTRWRLQLVEDAPRQSASAIVSVSSDGDRVELIAPGAGRVVRSVVVHHQPSVWALTPSEVVLEAESPDGRQQLVAIDASAGRPLWRQTVEGDGRFFPPRTADGVTIAGTIPGAASNTATYTALELKDGRRLWSVQHRTVSTGSTGDLHAAGAGLALMVDGDALHALDIRTGVLRWKRRLAGWSPSSRIVAGARWVVVIDKDRVTVLNARDGTRHWSRPLSATGLRAHGPAAIVDGQLLIPLIPATWPPDDEE
jgi:outer membrane protein assembly factor BamB